MNVALYHDTRIEDREVLIEHHVTCHENPKARAYTFYHNTDIKDETVYCPGSFNLWGGKNLAAIQSSSFQSLKGQRMSYVKEYSAAITVFHESTHCEGIFGDNFTRGKDSTSKYQNWSKFSSANTQIQT
jgi:hypothetical protein